MFPSVNLTFYFSVCEKVGETGLQQQKLCTFVFRGTFPNDVFQKHFFTSDCDLLLLSNNACDWLGISRRFAEMIV